MIFRAFVANLELFFEFAKKFYYSQVAVESGSGA